jgi:hypothetical protein
MDTDTENSAYEVELAALERRREELRAAEEKRYQQEIEDSRLKIFFLSERAIVNSLDGRRGLYECYSLALEPRLPEGYTIRGVHHQPHRRAFSVLVHHPSFEPVGSACEIPWINDELPFQEVLLCRGDDGRYEVTVREPTFQTNTAMQIATKEELNLRRILEGVLRGIPEAIKEAREICDV